MKLTDLSVSKLKPNKADAVYYDDDLPGFGIRIREGGSRNYVVRYRLGGLERRHTIGSASFLSLEEARKRARKALVAVDEGKDPTAEKIAKRAASGLILKSVMEDYLKARERDMRPGSHSQCARHLQQYWKPLHGLAVGNVTRLVIAARLRTIVDQHGLVAANRSRST